jgi:hypothetical protein
VAEAGAGNGSAEKDNASSNEEGKKLLPQLL